MPAFNPTERSSLMDLLSALQGGMSGGQGYSILGDILGQQSQRIDQRQAELGSLTDLLTNAASGGMAYEGASALADAYTRGSNVPPRIEDVLGSLYPTGGPPNLNYRGQVMDAPMGNAPGTPYGAPGAPVQGPQATSPVAQGPDFATAQAMQEQTLQAQMSPTIAGAFAAQAVALTQPHLDPTTNQEIPGLTPEQVIVKMVTTDEFLALPPQTQAMVVQLVQAKLQTAQEANAAAPANPAGGGGVGSVVGGIIGGGLGAIGGVPGVAAGTGIGADIGGSIQDSIMSALGGSDQPFDWQRIGRQAVR